MATTEGYAPLKAEDGDDVLDSPTLPVKPLSRRRRFIPLLLSALGGAVLFAAAHAVTPASTWPGDVGFEQLQQAANASCSPLPTPVVDIACPAAVQATTCGISSDLLDEFGSHNFRLSQVHVGSGYRIQKVLAKAQRGEKVRIGVIGGSVSLGHGTHPETGRRFAYGAIPVEEQWHQYVRRYIASIAGVEPDFVNGAIAATDSTFFEWCYVEAIGTDLDLVMVEMAVNDEYSDGMESSENLLRSLLQLPSQPAVLYADSFALRSEQQVKALLNGQDLQNSLASFYDVAQISARPALLPAMIRNNLLEGPLFKGDPRHVTTLGHRFIGSMIVGYLQEEACRAQVSVEKEEEQKDEAEDRRKGKRALGRPEGWAWPDAETLGQVPKVKMNEAWNARVKHGSAPPTCQIAGKALKPVEMPADWTLYDWKKTKYYYETKVPNSQPIVFEATIPRGGAGSIALSYLRSSNADYHLGLALCTAGTQSATLDGRWESSRSVPQSAVIARDLPAGKHRVECRTLEPREGETQTAFRIVGVMTA
ncbi:hypothetical protein JCM10207_000725 [Rhodosporidiobolus poonsookiae]